MNTTASKWKLFSRNLSTAIPKSILPKILIESTLGFLLWALLSQLSIQTPWSPVPITGQTLALLISLTALSPLGAASSTGLYFFSAAIGAPVLAGGASLAATGPSLGYLVGMLLSALLLPTLRSSSFATLPRFIQFLSLSFLAELLTFGFGCLWLSYLLSAPILSVVSIGVTPFLPGEVIKIFLAWAGVHFHSKFRE